MELCLKAQVHKVSVASTVSGKKKISSNILVQQVQLHSPDSDEHDCHLVQRKKSHGRNRMSHYLESRNSGFLRFRSVLFIRQLPCAVPFIYITALRYKKVY